MMEGGRNWAEIVAKYGNPHNASLVAGERFDIAETIAMKVGTTSPKVNFIGGGLVAVSVATSGYQIAVGIKEVRDGHSALGAVDVAGGLTGTGLLGAGLFGVRLGLVSSAMGAVAEGMAGYAAATSLLAPFAAGLSVGLAVDSVRSAVTGELSSLEVADRAYGSGFSDIYHWQKESVAARVILGVTTSGASEVWSQLNEFVSR
jgi:hypothetical protein